jgi:hypothetical protein
LETAAITGTDLPGEETRMGFFLPKVPGYVEEQGNLGGVFVKLTGLILPF